MNTQHILLTLVFITVISFVPGSSAEAAAPVGRFGWQAMTSEVVGDDTSCGADKVKQELYIREIGTGNPVSVSDAFFMVNDIADGADPIFVSGTGPVIGPLCFHPDTQRVVVDIIGGPEYHDFRTYNAWLDPTLVPRGKHLRMTVWVTPSSAGVMEYAQRSPVNTITNKDPSYKLDLNSFPTTYGAMGVSRASLFVKKWDVDANAFGSTVVNSSFPISGGTGVKTLPAQALADGWYAWSFYVALNGTHDAGGGFIQRDELMTGYGDLDRPFMLDTVPPVIDATTGHTPSDPYSSEQVTVTGSASDPLAGITNVKVFIDGQIKCSQDFSYKQTPSACVVAVGPYAKGTTHPYYVVATDGAGNVTTSPVQNFTISRLPVVRADADTTCGSKAINLKWNSSPGARSYEVKRNSGIPFDVGNVTAYTDTGLDDSTSYSYLVRAMQTRGPSDWSDVAAVETTAPPCSFAITAALPANGTLTPPGATPVLSGAGQSYAITPTGAFTIEKVFVDGVNDPAAATNGEYNFTNVLAPHTISATFAAIPLPPAPTMNPNQTVSSGAVWSVTMTASGSSVDCEFTRTSAAYGNLAPALVGLSYTANAAAGAFIGPGTATYRARCKDTYGQWSPVATSVVTVNAPRISSQVSPPPGNLGETPIGGDTSSVTFRVANPTGDIGSLLSGTITLSDPHFTCAPCSYANIPVGGWQDIIVTYLPTDVGVTDSGSITFMDNASTSPFVKAVWGKGISPIVFAAAPVNFGNVPIIRSKDLTLVVKNISKFQVGPSTISVPAPYSCVPAFECANAFTIPALGSKSITLHFQPTAVQFYPAVGTLLPQGYDFTITGGGVSAALKVEKN